MTKTIHVVAALIRKGEHIFATQRGYGELKGGWEFPGGKVQEGETPQEALVREIKEELETDISVGRFCQTIEYDYPDFHLSMDCYWCTVIRGELTLKEHMNARWLTREELDSVDWLPADQTLIDTLKKEGFAIRNLIFDVGHVLLEYRWKDMLMDHGLCEEESIRIGEEIFSAPFWTDKFDRGVWDKERMIQEYGSIYPDDVEHIRWFLDHARQMRGADRPVIWDAVHKLREMGYRTYILSNYSKYLFDLHTEGLSFVNDMDGMVVSYEPNAIKPENEIYYYLRDKYNISLEESIFFDDRLENIEKGFELGMDGLWVRDRKMLEDVLISFITL